MTADPCLPVPYLQENIFRIMWDPKIIRRSRELAEQLHRIETGESTPETEFGPTVSVEELTDHIYADRPSLPRRYPLPKHLHWMGEQ